MQGDQKSSEGCSEIYFYSMYNMFVEDEMLCMLKTPVRVQIKQGVNKEKGKLMMENLKV